MIEAHNLSPQESSKEKGKKVEKSVRQTKQSIAKSIEENDKDATILLSMGTSYSQYERERLGLCYQSKSDAEKCSFLLILCNMSIPLTFICVFN
jgi:hypothetical protein